MKKLLAISPQAYRFGVEVSKKSNTFYPFPNIGIGSFIESIFEDIQFTIKTIKEF